MLEEKWHITYPDTNISTNILQNIKVKNTTVYAFKTWCLSQNT